MEGNVLRGNPMYLRFRLSYQGKDSQGPLFCPGAYPGVLYQFSYILPGMMVMTAPMMVMVFMFVMMFMMMRIGMFVAVTAMMMILPMAIIIMGNVIGPAFQFDNPMDTGYTAPVFPDKLQGPAI
jgi:hypothetical protein